MIRHLLSEGARLLMERPLVSLALVLALTIGLTLGGMTASVALWLHPLIAATPEEAPVAVLLRPELPEEARERWLDETRAEHPDWRLEEVSRDELERRLQEWFPYLGGLLEDDPDALLPPLVEVRSPDSQAIRSLERSPAVLAVGPAATFRPALRSGVRRLELLFGGTSVSLAAAAFLMAAIWVHLELYRHADELAVMRLVGATESSIRGPYLVAASLPGLVSGALAVVVTLLTGRWLSGVAAGLGLPAVDAPGWVLAGQLVFGLGVPLAAAAVTLTRHAHLEAARI